MNHKYTLKNRGHRIWDIFAPGKENEKPVISLNNCDQKIAQERVDSLNEREGVPPDLTGAITKGKEIKS